jgi:hypothetical protein
MKVRRRGDDGHAISRTDAHRDHVLRHLLPQADAGVEALRHDVREAPFDAQLDLEVGISGKQLFHL